MKPSEKIPINNLIKLVQYNNYMKICGFCNGEQLICTSEKKKKNWQRKVKTLRYVQWINQYYPKDQSFDNTKSTRMSWHI